LLAGQIDQLGRLACSAYRRLDHRGRFAGDGHDRAIVIGIHRQVEEEHSLHAHRSHNGLDPPDIFALGKVRNALDD
jgi:hypothetical protein